MARSNLLSKFHSSVLLQRSGTWFVNFIPVRIARLFWLMLWHRENGLTGALSRWLPYRIRPLAYFATASVAFEFALSLHPVYRSDVNWFDVLTALDTKDSCAVWEDLKLPDNLLEIVYLEKYWPNTSPASKVIKDKVGSDDGLKFALYVGTLDTRLGSLLAAKATLMQKLNSCEDKVRDFASPFIFQATIIPLYFLGNTRKKSFTQTRNVWFSMQGTWLLAGTPVLVMGAFVPFGHTSASLVVAFIDFAYLIALTVYHFKGFHFTHGTGIVRYTFSLLLGFTIIVLIGTGLEYLLDLLATRFGHYFA
jgi:hypothetical protein